MKRIWLIFTLFAVLAGNLSAGQTEASVFLWKDGKSGYRIILPSKYENQGIRLYLHQAAERLQSAIKEASGVVMPIAEEDSLDAKTPAIFIGNTLEAQRQGIIPASLPDFSYLIAVRNGNVFLCGMTDMVSAAGNQNLMFSIFLVPSKLWSYLWKIIWEPVSFIRVRSGHPHRGLPVCLYRRD